MGLFDDAKALCQAVDVAADIGCGIRPQEIVPCKTHIAVDPFLPYLIRLRSEWNRPSNLVTAEGTWDDFLGSGKQFDSLVLLDVIEHLDKDHAKRLLSETCFLARDQVVVFTPLGFVEQTKDAWGMGGDRWQTHRSGWTPDDFFGWEILVDEAFEKTHGAFFAIWTRP